MSEALSAALLVLAVPAALVRPGWLLMLERPLRVALTRPRGAARWTSLVVGVTLLAQVGTGLLTGLPEADVHDEHSLLLQADTFLRGRIANPSPPLWRHFETFHVLVQPTYAAKYPPAQAGVLALGRLLGHPVFGQWLAGALLLAATAWMLHAWLPPPWARLGTLLVAANVVICTWWSFGFTGPFAAAAAGALLLGAAERLRRRPGAREAAVLGLALALLAASRPYEGLVLAVAVLVPLGWRAAREPGWSRAARRAAVWATLPLVAGLGWLAYSNQRVTGDPLRLPFTVYDQRYAHVPLFLWQDLRATPPANPRMDAFYREFEMAAWREQRTARGWLRAAGRKPYLTLEFYLQPPFLVGLLALPLALRDPRARRAAWAAAAVLAAQLVIVPTKPHYAAPAAALLSYLAVEAWRHARLWRPRVGRGGRRAPVGRALAAAAPFALLLAIPARVPALRPEPEAWQLVRAELQRRLERRPGGDLVLVAYDPRSSPHAEWVYNGADLDSTPVLWARSLSPADDCALMLSQVGRRPWLLEVVEEITPPRLVPFPTDRCPGAAPRTAPAAPPPATAR